MLYVLRFKDYTGTLSLKFVPAQVRGNNHWSTSQVRLKVKSYCTRHFGLKVGVIRATKLLQLATKSDFYAC
jgi:hypothetical protein